MEVLLIRHTRPDISPGLIYGRLDVPLASSFVEEREAILKLLPERMINVYSSPSQRCTQLAAHLSSFFITDEDLCEMSFGAWEGYTWETINREESEFWLEDFVNRCPPDGESLKDMQTRVTRFWNKLLQSDAEHVVIVTHAGVIRLILAQINRLSLDSFFDINVQYGEVIRVKAERDLTNPSLKDV